MDYEMYSDYSFTALPPSFHNMPPDPQDRGYTSYNSYARLDHNLPPQPPVTSHSRLPPPAPMQSRVPPLGSYSSSSSEHTHVNGR